MLHGVLLAGWLLSQAAPSPLSPRSLQATQQAYANHVNDCAQHTIVCATDTPIPTATLRPTATPQPAPTSTPSPTDIPEMAPDAMPESCWVTDHELGDPDSGYIVFWLFRDADGNEDYRPLSCDQAWVITPAPTQAPTLVPPPRAPAPPSAASAGQPQVVRVEVTRVVVVTPPPRQVSESADDAESIDRKPSPRPTLATSTPEPSSTPLPATTYVPYWLQTPTPRASLTAAETLTPTPAVIVAGSNSDRPPSQPFDFGGWLLKALGLVAVIVAVIAWVIWMSRLGKDDPLPPIESEQPL